MPFCINCGQELPEGAKFCLNCGKPINETTSTAKRETVYDGKIHKCPKCGETLTSFSLNCPMCGHELRDTNSSKTASELAERLEYIENSREYEETQSIFHKIIYGDKISKTDQLKIATIQNFNIPNNKEDLVEFLILATSNINFENNQLGSASDIAFSKVWSAKFEQAYNKIQYVSAKEPEFETLIQKYEKIHKKVQWNKRSTTMSFVDYIRFFIFAIIMVIIAFAIITPIVLLTTK